MVTPDDVRAAYRLILGREPENEALPESLAKDFEELSQLRRVFLNSDEFRRMEDLPPVLPPPVIAQTLPLDAPPLAVEVLAARPDLERMMARVAAFRTRLGEEAPHWSILTVDRFRPERIEAERGTFYATGKDDLTTLRGVLARIGLAPADLPRVVEYGCGAGRVTLHLARSFGEVTTCDLSRPHLDVAEQYLGEQGLTNLRYHHVTPEALIPRGSFDLFFSVLTLQHNPPPVIHAILEAALEQLSPGGVAVFQLPAHMKDYRFTVAEYLGQPGAGLEMHCMPQREVFALAEHCGCKPMDVRENTRSFTQDPLNNLSMLYAFRKPAIRG
ncbi:class I SAM-dependent methyltransferase [Roseomonas sp. BN140053]|uniref:class I SAM-dependent methyltransferase n=1 Tax=Roseomonas sp. BN140053 TaxID=3391898 RepID=UPI0039E7AC7E